jgi:hypothetical protein
VKNDLFKVLDRNGKAVDDRSGQWPMPVDSRPGKWMIRIEKHRLEQEGYILYNGAEQLLGYLGPTVWLAEFRGFTANADGHLHCVEARLLERLAN